MRLRHPDQGTVVTVGDDLARAYIATGWEDADRTAETKKPTARRRKTTTED